MVRIHKPRSGSLAFYPRKRAKQEKPVFKTFPAISTVKPLNFYAYKVGMTHILIRNEAEKTVAFGQDIFMPCTILEVPPITVYGIRAYENTPYGLKTVGDFYAENFKKELFRRQPYLKKMKKRKDIAELDKLIAEQKASELRLLCHTNPGLTGIGKKTPELVEIALGGEKIEDKLNYAKEKLGKDINIVEVFKEKQFIDVKAVNKGKGFSGVVERFGVKIQRRKAKYRRVVGSIGPWHPPLVMWTVPRPGQHGYQTRTIHNLIVVKIGENPEEINAEGGFTNYGIVRNPFMLVSGSVPGPQKRLIALREPIRPANEKRLKLGEISFVYCKDRKLKREKIAEITAK